MLKSLLEFNPFFRPSATELLKSPIFDHIRMNDLDIAKESMADFEIYQASEFDRYFNYN